MGPIEFLNDISFALITNKDYVCTAQCVQIKIVELHI